MAGENAAEIHVVPVKDPQDVSHSVSGIHHYGVTSFSISDEIHEIGHLGGHRVIGREIPSRKKLTKIEPVTGHTGKRSETQKTWLIQLSPNHFCCRGTASWW